MTFQADIFLTVLQAKDIAGCWGENFVNMEKNGDDVDKCCYMNLMLLMRWIKIMESYYCNNYTTAGNVAEPNFVCLTLAQAQELLSKIKILAKL
tara:strand:- start:319 stop:600 length:282 start_codon:yes stop_codon:yes gene_type:complete